MYVAARYVHPNASGTGAGRALLDHALCAMHRDGRYDITLWDFAANAAARRVRARRPSIPDGTETVDPQWCTSNYATAALLRSAQLPPVLKLPKRTGAGFK